MRALCVREGPEFDLEKLEALVGHRAIGRLRLLARRLHLAFHGRVWGTTVWHINSSGSGGGVADILNSLVPFSNKLGVPTQWLVIGGDERFFQITKAFHNALQGNPRVELTAEDLGHYERTIADNALMLDELMRERGWTAPDVIVLHDPQPSAFVAHLRARFRDTRFIWHGHIQIDLEGQEPSHSGQRVWELLASYINQCDGAVFHLPEQIPPGITVPVRCFLPSINPLGYLNRDLAGPAGERFIGATLTKYGMQELLDGSIPLVAQVARFDPWKDPIGVIQAYREAHERLAWTSPQPHLVLAGPLAEDDPEAFRVLAELDATIDGDRAVHIVPLSATATSPSREQQEALQELGINPLTLTPAALLDLEINAFQTRADVIVAKSIREGFGLAVTGAGYHAKPRIVSEVGGLRAQVVDNEGRVHACLVGGTPHFSREASIRMTRDWLVTLLSAPRLRRVLGTRARRHVIRAFLPHRHLEDYFSLFLNLRLGLPLNAEPGEARRVPTSNRTPTTHVAKVSRF